MYKLFKLITFCATFSILACQNLIANESDLEIAQEPKNVKDLIESLDAHVEQALEMFNVPGAAIGIVIDNKVILGKGYGYRHLAQHLPVTENTLFPIASCTKAFTAFILGQLVDEGKIAWDDPVIKHIPEFRLINSELTLNATIRDLAAHRTGMPRHDPIWFFLDIPKSDVIRLLPYCETDLKLREKFQYNNFMYSIAGTVIERVTGQTWEEAVFSRIFMPLSMLDSNTSLEQLQMSFDFSFPYAEIDGNLTAIPFRKMTAVRPGGGIHSTVSDLLKWVQLQLSNGTIFNQHIIQKETLQETHTVQMPLPLSENEEVYQLGYGLGWLIGVYKGHDFINHGGDIDGFSSDISLLPQEKIGIVILTNSSSDGRYVIYSIRNFILDKLLTAKESNWIAEAEANRRTTKQALQKLENNQEAIPSYVLQKYVGDYEHPAYGIVHVYMEDGDLLASYGQVITPLRHQRDNLFKGQFRELLIYSINPIVEFSFFDDSSHEISELRIPFESFRGAKPIVFKRLAHQRP